MELWDAYNLDFTLIPGVTLHRGSDMPDEDVPEGMYHLVSDIVLKHEDGTYLITRRSLDKPNHPGMWELTAGGAALKGEDALTCAKRELWEETGIKGENFVELGSAANLQKHTIFKIFSSTTSAPKDSVVLLEGETIDYKWVTAEEIRNMTDDELLAKRIRPLVKELQR